MERIPEPELMDDAEQATAYAEADFSEPNRRFLELYRERFPTPPAGGAVLDIGCGPGDITLRLARAWPEVEITGLDGARRMLDLAERALAATPELGERVSFIHGMIPDAALPRDDYATLVSNSLLHHLHRPASLWEIIRRAGGPGAPVLVMDLFRPASPDEARALVDQYASDEPEVLRRDFLNSLLAAFTPAEVADQLRSAGMGNFRVETVSDRHLAVWGRLPG